MASPAKTRIWLNLLGVVLVLAVAVAAFTAVSHGNVPAPPGWLLSRAQSLAYDRNFFPSSAAYCLTTLAKAGPAVGMQPSAVGDPNEPVYLVVCSGQFSTPSYPAEEASLTTFAFVVDAHGRTVLRYDMTSRPADTRAVGRMFRLF
jgi:hypothetical protein